MRLRVEEDLGVHDALLARATEIHVGQLGEIVFGAEHVHPGVVEVEERLQVGELVGAPQRLDRRVGQRHAVALGEREDQLRLERALDVQVELRFRDRERVGGHQLSAGWLAIQCRAMSMRRQIQTSSCCLR